MSDEQTKEEKLREMLTKEHDVLAKWIGDAQSSKNNIANILKDKDATEDVLMSGIIVARAYILGIICGNNTVLNMDSIDTGKPLHDLFLYEAMKIAKQVKQQSGTPQKRLILPN